MLYKVLEGLYLRLSCDDLALIVIGIQLRIGLVVCSVVSLLVSTGSFVLISSFLQVLYS
jgi:hypothetical protein